MSKINTILSIILVLSLGYAGLQQYTKYQENQEEIKIIQKRSPVCFNVGQYRILRFYKGSYYHFIYIHRDSIVDYFKTTENSGFVEYLDLVPESKTKCTKISTLTFDAKFKLKSEDMLLYLREILYKMDML